MSRSIKLFTALLSVIFCISLCSLCVGAEEYNDESEYSDAQTNQDSVDDNGNSGDDVVSDVPQDNAGDTNSDDNSGYYDDNNNSDDSGYYDDSSSAGNSDEDYYYYDDSDSNSNDSYDYGYSDDYSNDYSDDSYDYNYSYESSYVGGGQTYVEPDSIAPSASLYESDGDVSEDTLESSDWDDIAERLKNASASDDGDDFSFIQNNTSDTDNGIWILATGIACLALSAAGIVYFIVLTLKNKKRKIPSAASAGGSSKSNRDYYGDGYKTSSAKKQKRSSKFDTADVALPKNTQIKRYKNGGRRYK